MSKAGSVIVGIIGSTALCLGIAYFGSMKAENDKKMVDALFGQDAASAIIQTYNPEPTQSHEILSAHAVDAQYIPPTLESIAETDTTGQESVSEVSKKCMYYNAATTDITSKIIGNILYGCK